MSGNGPENNGTVDYGSPRRRADLGFTDYMFAVSILTVPTLVCITVVAVCVYVCFIRPQARLDNADVQARGNSAAVPVQRAPLLSPQSAKKAYESDTGD